MLGLRGFMPGLKLTVFHGPTKGVHSSNEFFKKNLKKLTVLFYATMLHEGNVANKLKHFIVET